MSENIFVYQVIVVPSSRTQIFKKKTWTRKLGGETVAAPLTF